MTNTARPTKGNILHALLDAQRIAFAPFIFQAVITAKRTGLLSAIDHAANGTTLEEAAQACGLSLYGTQVLSDVLAQSGVLAFENGRYTLTKTGLCLLYDPMTSVNLDFTADVCYRGLSHLKESIEQGRAAGLCELGNWTSIYPHLSELPGHARNSWFRFDHFYSDRTFESCADWISTNLSPKRLFDIGGNTGKFAAVCMKKMPNLDVTLIDLPEQCQLAKNNPDLAFAADRFHTSTVNWLDKEAIPQTNGTADIVWMSQFLDCFTPDEAIGILKRAAQLLSPNGCIAIVECLWDSQEYEAARLSLVCTSLYFTALANGNSRFYSSQELLELIRCAGLEVTEEKNNLGVSHSLIICRVKTVD